MSEPIFIGQLITRITNGEVRVPSFQRGFVWNPDRVAHLMDSIYKGYPFGTLLFWRTGNKLKTERCLGPFQLPPAKKDYPIDYVLDGQQRATSIFGVFQSVLQPTSESDSDWTNIYFDLSVSPSAQDSQFTYLRNDEVDSLRHFPLKLLFDPPKYRKYVGNLPDDAAAQVDELYKRFTTAAIPVQSFQTDDRAAVAIVFERINRMGVKLDTLQLLSAWSWSDDFDLQEQFDEIADEVSPYGFGGLAEDSDLLLRCCAAIIANDASPSSIVDLKGDDVRNRFSEIKTGIRGAIDFLRTHFHVYSLSSLPFTTLLVPLSVFFATDKEQSAHPNATQQERLVKWIWRTLFTRRYSKRLEQLNQDVKEIVKLKGGDTSCALGSFSANVDNGFFADNAFSVRNVDSKTFILMLAASSPRDFIGGGKVALDSVLREGNKKEFHHLYPRSYLKQIGVPDNRIDALVNFCIIPRSSNNKIGNKKPSQYKLLMPKRQASLTTILRSALCPNSLFDDDFAQFAKERAEILTRYAKLLIGK